MLCFVCPLTALLASHFSLGSADCKDTSTTTGSRFLLPSVRRSLASSRAQPFPTVAPPTTCALVGLTSVTCCARCLPAPSMVSRRTSCPQLDLQPVERPRTTSSTTGRCIMLAPCTSTLHQQCLSVATSHAWPMDRCFVALNPRSSSPDGGLDPLLLAEPLTGSTPRGVITGRSAAGASTAAALLRLQMTRHTLCLGAPTPSVWLSDSNTNRSSTD